MKTGNEHANPEFARRLSTSEKTCPPCRVCSWRCKCLDKRQEWHALNSSFSHLLPLVPLSYHRPMPTYDHFVSLRAPPWPSQKKTGKKGETQKTATTTDLHALVHGEERTWGYTVSLRLLRLLLPEVEARGRRADVSLGLLKRSSCSPPEIGRTLVSTHIGPLSQMEIKHI